MNQHQSHTHHASAMLLPFYAPPLRRTALALLIAACFGTAQANPALPQVVNGQATFNQQGNVFSITNTPNTIINWQSFSIHAGEITRFIQENGNSAVLNRITGQDPSSILGALESNGKVFLINPNGIVFGQGARVDVNGLVASSLGMSNDDFLAGKRQFTAGTVAGGVSNAGAIHAGQGGQVLLIAPNVENTGIITAPNGEVILAAGRSVQLADPGNPELRVLVSAPADQALNLGQIIAQGGAIGMAGALVSQRGVLNANSAVVGESGKIVLKASGQTVLSAGSVTSATGAGKGGDVQVLGDQVGLFGDARVDASGRQGGGTVLVGGDYQGKNSAVQNARQVVINKDASIAADAIDNGKGGKVIVWGDDSARMYGSISARGGAAGGDGGFVETSGHFLAVDGARVDTRARSGQGKTGDWLLDPYNITVVSGSSGAGLDQVDDFSDVPTSTASTTEVAASLISAATSNVRLQALHRIDFNSAINMTNAGVGLTAQAGEQINVNTAITTNGGNVTLSANDAGASSAAGPGAVVNLNSTITTGNGNLSITGASVLGSGSLLVGSGNLSLLANHQDGGINLTGDAGQVQGTGTAGQTVVLQANHISFSGGMNFGGTAAQAKVTIKALAPWRDINLGTKSDEVLGLSKAEVSSISASSLTIGDSTSTASIQISDALNTAGDLHLNAGVNITATADVKVGGTFSLDRGAWSQNMASLPAFSANNFVIAPNATFLRATGGDGSGANPYLIADIYGLQGVTSLNLDNSYRLTGNIDASGTANWNGARGFVPIAGGDGRYGGTFDGAGFSISNLLINGGQTVTGPAGLFGTVHGGSLKNLGLSGGSVTGTSNVGALVGNVMSGSKIDNVTSSMAVNGQSNVGGLVGLNAGTITASASSGGVTGANADGAGAIGGLVGFNWTQGNISTSYATGAVTGTREMIGGLVGNNQGTLTQSYASGNVSGGRSIGGLVGLNSGAISNAYASGAVSGAPDADAIVVKENMGGVIGWNAAGASVDHVYAGGAVNGSGFAAVGGVVGRADVTLSAAYWNIETSGVATDAGGAIGRTSAQMQQQGSFDGFDFGSTWRIYDGYTTPMLKAFLKPLTVTVSGNATSKVYDGQFAIFNGSLVYLGLLDGDTAASGALNYQSARNVGNYALTGLWSTKYDITVNGATSLAITPRALTVGVGGSKGYDGQVGFANPNFTLGNVVDGDSIGVSGSAVFLDKNAGTNKAVHASGLALTGNALGNYSLDSSTADGMASITARTLNISFTGISKTYDGKTSADVQIGDDRVAGDTLNLSGSANFSDKNAGAGKAINVTDVGVTGADAGNYVLSTHSGSTTADIAARTLNVSFNGINKTYDGNTLANVNFGDDRVAGDALNLSGSASFGDKNAGTGKTVNVTDVGVTGADAGNYVLSTHSGSTTADILARTLNLSFTGIGKTYDGKTTANVQIGDDRVAGDALNLSGSASFGDKNAGTGKTVNVTDVGVTGADAGNYVLNTHSGSTTADIAARTLNVSFNGINKTYDGHTVANVNFGDDRVAGDALNLSGSASFSDKNAGAGKTVNVTDVGVSGADAGNYVLNTHSGSTTADIAARTLNVSFNGINKTYDGHTVANVNFGDDRVAGDALNLSGSASFGDKNAGTGKTVNVTDVGVTGVDAGNYVLNAHSGITTADIAARTLNVSFNGIGKTYDGHTVANVNFGDDRVAGDALNLSGSANFSDKNAGAGKTVNVTDVGVSGVDAGNYVLNTHSGSTTADIAARTLNVSFNGIGKTYDGHTVANVNFGDDRVAGDALNLSGSANFSDKNAGTGKTVNVTDVGVSGVDAGNYVLNTHSGSTTADIAARTLNVSFNGINKTYDGYTVANVNFGDDRVAGDALSLSGSANFSDKNAGTGKAINVTDVGVSGVDAGNYVLNTHSGSTTADIAARTLNVSFNGINKTYDGHTVANVNFGDDRVAGDALSLSGSASFSDKNAGTGKAINVTDVGVSGVDAGNYVLNTHSGSTTADIAARTLNVSFNGINKTYDGKTSADVQIGDNRVAGDALTLSGSASFSDKNAGAGKTVNVMNVGVSGVDAGNYVLSTHSGSTTADIAARTLNVSFNGINKTYDGHTVANVNFGDDRVAGDALSLSGSANFSDKNAGTGKAINVTDVGVSGVDAGNYVLNTHSGSTTADIAARTLNVSFNGINKTYDGHTVANVNFGDDRVAGDALNLSGSANFSDKNAGTGKAINVTDVGVSGVDAGNYVLNTHSGSTTADIAARTLNVSFNGINKTYDGHTVANVNFGDDRVAGDALNLSGSANFSDKNAGTGKTVNVTDVGVSGADAGNYVLNTHSGSTTADIAARTLNVSFNGINKTYDGHTVANVNFGDDRVAGDVLNLSGSANFSDKNAGAGKAINVTDVGVSGVDAGNYVLNMHSGSTTADIAARTLNVSFNGINKTYDGHTVANVNFGDDRVAGDALNLSGSANFSDKNAGAAKTVNVTDVGVNGADAGNYVLNTHSGSTTADIAARTLNVSFNGINKTYDGHTVANVNFGDDRVAGDALNLSGSASFSDKNAGTAKTVNVTDVGVSGVDAGNYVLNMHSGSTTADIAARTLNVSFNGINKTYDGHTVANVNFGDDRVAGDALNVSGSANFNDKNAGTGKAVNVTDVGVSGLDAGNYVLNTHSGSTTADIAARTLNVSFNGINKTYDGHTVANVNFGDDRVAGDALNLSGSASFSDKNAGTGKTVNVTDVGVSGVDAGNYVLSTHSGSTTADIAARTLNVSFNGINKTYDGHTVANVNFGDDRVAGDALNVSGRANFNDKNAGAGKAVNVTDVGVSGVDAGNYVLNTHSGSTTADIAARTLNVSFNGIGKTYDGKTSADVQIGDNRVAGDALTLSGSASFSDKNAGTGKTVNVTNVGVTGADAGNYVLSTRSGSTTATIAARALNVSGVGVNKIYDGGTAAGAVLGDDRIAGDVFGVSAAASFADKNVGTNKAVTLSNVALAGQDAGNYFIVLPTGLLASITPATLNLAGLNAGNKVYDGTTNALVSATASGVLGSDVVSVVGGSGTFADKNAGVNKQVTASGFRLAGVDAGNYVLNTTGGTAQASISQKLLSTWIGSGNGLWSDAANWDGGVVPEGANVLAVDFSHSNGIVTYSAAAGNTTLKNLNTSSGLLVTGGSLSLGDGAQDRSVLGGNAGLEITGGNLLLNGSLSADRYVQSGGVLGGSGNLAVGNSFSQTAGAINLGGQLAITQASGDLRLANVTAQDVRLSALNGAIGQSGTIVANSLTTQSLNGTVLGNAGNQIGNFTASNSAGGGIVLNNTSAPGTLTLGALSSGAGNIAIDNTGGIVASNINANGGNVTLTAHSPVTLNGVVNGNDITVAADTDLALADGARLTAARNVSLTAGRDISFAGNASVTLAAASSMSVLAKTGNITGTSGVRINRLRADVTLLAPGGSVNMADTIFLPATVKPVITPGISTAIDDALSVIKQGDHASSTLAAAPAPASAPVSGTAPDKKKDDVKEASATDQPTGNKFNDTGKKMYCN